MILEALEKESEFIYEQDEDFPKELVHLIDSNLIKGKIGTAVNLIPKDASLELYLKITASGLKRIALIQAALEAGEPREGYVVDSFRQLKRTKVGGQIGAVSDSTSYEDQLNFNSYIQAFSDLIESPYTQMPVTIGVFGPWGVGKTFLFEKLARETRIRQKKRRQERRKKSINRVKNIANLFNLYKNITTLFSRYKKKDISLSNVHVHVVQFNAWEYSASEVIWPGLVRKIMDFMEKQFALDILDIFLFKVKRNLSRYLNMFRSQVITLSAIAVGTLISIFVFQSDLNFSLFWKSLATLGSVGLFTVIADTFSKPISQWISNLFQGRSYGKHAGYMSEIRSDLTFLVKKLEKREGRVLIIIDDLDRCEPKKAVEVLQAIKLLLNFDRFIVFLGLDARVITRAVEKYYQNFLGTPEASGYEYLDKIVQIPFCIPQLDTDTVQKFIRSQLYASNGIHPKSLVSKQKSRTVDMVNSGLQEASTQLTQGSQGMTASHRISFTTSEIEAFQNLAPFMRRNPRHIKRLVNFYRLVRKLTEQQGEEHLILDNPVAVISWVVICSQWPYSTNSMLGHLRYMLDKKIKPPEDEDPLDYLLKSIESKFDESKNREKRRKLDDNPYDLDEIIAYSKKQLGWKDLISISKYTFNFNPLVEAELDEVPEKKGEKSSSQN